MMQKFPSLSYRNILFSGTRWNLRTLNYHYSWSTNVADVNIYRMAPFSALNLDRKQRNAMTMGPVLWREKDHPENARHFLPCVAFDCVGTKE